MLIQKYDLYNIKLNDFSHIDITPIIKPINKIYQIRMFLIYAFGSIRRRGILNCIDAIESYSKDGMKFEEVEIYIDNNDNLVYLSESYHTYDQKSITPEINELFEQENFIALCKIGFLDHITMTKKNFIYLLFRWNKILDLLSPFALLYQDEHYWYDILPFETEEIMRQFVADHLQK